MPVVGRQGIGDELPIQALVRSAVSLALGRGQCTCTLGCALEGCTSYVRSWCLQQKPTYSVGSGGLLLRSCMICIKAFSWSWVRDVAAFNRIRLTVVPRQYACPPPRPFVQDAPQPLYTLYPRGCAPVPAGATGSSSTDLQIAAVQIFKCLT